MPFVTANNYNLEKLKETINNGGDKDSSDEIDKIYTEDIDPSHECPVCQFEAEIDDHQRRTPYWCEKCEEIRKFVKL